MSQAAGVEKAAALREAGFNDTEIGAWQQQTRQELASAGFSGQEVDEYFGAKNPDMAPMKAYFEGNLKAAVAEKAAKPDSGAQAPHPAQGFLEDLQAGWQMSVSGLASRGKLPDTVLPEDAGTFARIASQVAALAGDLPAMLPGAIAGGAAGSVAPIVGNVAGAGAGAMALPAAVRKILVDHYEKGDIHSFSDFWERASGTFLETVKSGAVGGLTAGAGGAVGKVLGRVASPVVTAGGRAAAEISTMVTVGKALEGEVPNSQDFVDAAILVGGIHGTTSVAGKLRTIYAKTGLKPAEIALEAQKNPALGQDLLSSNVELPKSLEGAVEQTPAVAAETKPAEAAPPVRSEAVQKILDQVGEKPEKTTEGYSLDKAYADFVDRLDPIKQATEQLTSKAELTTDKDPYDLARMTNDYRAKVKHAVENGTLDYKTLAKNGESLKEILKPFEKDLPDFEAFLISKRALEIEGRGLQSGFDPAAAQEVVKAGAAKYETAAQNLVEFQNRNLQYLRDAGVLSEKSFQAMVEAGKSYIPFSRLLGEEAAGGKGGKPSSLKRIKGSDAKIQSPILSILENTEAVMKTAEVNRAAEAFVALAEKTKDQELVKKVPTAQRPIEVKAEEVAKFFKEQGIEADPEAFSIFRPVSKNLGENEFQVYRDGKREVYQTTPELAQAFKALNGDSTGMHMVVKIMRGITAIKKIGISLTPDFILRNAIRDQLTAGTFSRAGVVPFTDIFGALGDLWKKNETYYNWLKSGGANGAFLELDSRYLSNDVFKLNQETKFLDSAINVIRKPVDMLKAVGELIEQAPRLAEFKRVSGGASAGGKVFEGGFASREVTVDFQRMGAKVAAFNAITAFQNVSIQGLDRTIRAIKEDPTGVTTKALTAITLPSVLLWWANKDDPRWKEIPRWQKDTFWILMTKDNVYRIPKPQELGIIFGSMPERVLEAFFTENPHAMKDFEETIGNALAPSLVPDAISPMIEQYFNKSLFTGTKVIPSSLEKVLPEYQYTDYTSDTAKMLGRLVSSVPFLRTREAASPAVIENYVRSWGGTLGMYALQLADKGLQLAGAAPDPVKPAATLSDIPFVKAFAVRYPSATAQSIKDFYDNYADHKRIAETIRHLAQSGEFEAVQRELAMEENQPLLVKLDGIKDALEAQSRLIQMINKNPQMKPEEKRQFIDATYSGMIETAKMGNELAEQMKKAFRQ